MGDDRGVTVIEALAAITLALAACVPSSPPAAPAPRRPDLRYVLELAEVAAPRLRITVELAAAADGTTTFDLDPWGRVEQPDEVFQNVTATADGRPVAVTHGAHAWVVHSAPRAELVLRYEVAAGGDPDRLERRYYPLVRAHLVHLFGNNALVSPHHLDDHRPKQIELRWAGFAAAGWTTLSSHGSAERAVVDLPLETFRDAEFLASDRVHVVRRQVGGAALVVALVDAEWSFSADELADAIGKLMAAEAKLVGEPFPPSFLIDLVPFRVDGSWEGAALHHAVIAQADPKATLVAHGKRPLALAWMFAHELFHTWTGGTIAPAVEDGEKWFTEGFTNFYARRVMVRAGLATLDDYVASLDATLEEYTTSPVRTAPEPAYALADERQRALAYARGDLLALAVDAEIQRASAGTRGLDDVMRELVADAHAGGKIDAAKLLARFARETSPDFVAKLRGVIERGELVTIDPASYAPCLRGAMREVVPFELGFDFAASVTAKRVVGLRAGSAAAAAGLLEGDELAGWSFVGHEVDQTVVIKVRRAGGVRAVAYGPKGPAVSVLGFRIDDASACATRL